MALAALAADPDRRAAMGAAARRLAETRFDRASLAATFVAVIEAAAAGQRRIAPLAPPIAA
jgi:glycosyltransferase involved in cell wall biosynthesis